MRILRPSCIALAAVFATNMVALAAPPETLSVLPAAMQYAVQPIDRIDSIEIPPIDLDEVALEDGLREADGMAPRFAIPHFVNITPDTDGTWEQLDQKTMLWRMRIAAPGALSLNLGFTRYAVPDHTNLFVYASDLSDVVGPYDERDNESHGELWTPVVLADDIIIEVTVPVDAYKNLDLELTSINYGYRGFGEPDVGRSGACNNDVICPEGDPWRAEIRSVGVISTGGSTFCTGFMVNNTAEDQTPYFMTANHCGINSGNASSLVVYWNFESPTCGQHGGGSLADHQTGSFFRASYSTSDFTLVELDSDPLPAWEVTFSGWDHSGNNATSACGIHHPNTDEKSISFEYQSTQVTSYLGSSSPGDGTHVRIVDWDDGTTEPGSSGSPVYDQNHHVIGQLHGGYAACGNDLSDWYGAFARSWTGGGSNSNRLSNWLDPVGSGAIAIDTLDPLAVGMQVAPGSGFYPMGDPGGPFTPGSVVFTISNAGDTSFNYVVTKTVNWLTITNASGTVGVGGNALVTVSVNANANSLGIGAYTDTLTFTNTSTGEGNTSRPVELSVGTPSMIYSWDMSTNPGWTTQGLWAYGHPTGGGGQYGNNDPSNGHTGSNVYGYNLNGDYENNLAERHLTTGVIDCTGLTQVELRFWRYLNVETSTYDHAYVRVSNNGSSWTTVWTNGGEITDSSWSQQIFDISAVADNQSTVYVRWTMGTTDSSWQYSGWNVDDVEIWGLNPIPNVSGDLDGDGDVDLGDLSILLASYGVDDGGDVDGDGDTDLTDLSILLANYGFGT